MIVATPSTVGLLGRVIILVLTVGLPCWFNSGSDDYLCNGQHGAVELLIPVAGPALFVTDHPRDSVIHKERGTLTSSSRVLLYTDTVVQSVGIASILAAVAFGAKEPVPQRKVGKAATPSGPNFFVLPISAPSTVGITVGFDRW